jgi:predicted GTPase
MTKAKGNAPGVAEEIGVPSSPSGQGDGGAALLRLAALGEEVGSKRVSEEARALAARVDEGRFYVACIGQFKRGKSTLINALIGEPVLPVGVTPATAVPTVVRHGERRRAQVLIRDRGWREVPFSDLQEYVCEERNPDNAKGVEGAEVFVPSPLLESGMCLVDTPGLGSVCSANTAATHALIPHIDAALLVLGADPPLTGEELALVRTLAQQVRDLIIVLNKADRTSDAERALAAEFTEQLLQKHLQRPIGPLFQVSAAERLAGRAGSQRDWDKLVEALQRLVEQSGRQLVRLACERGLTRLSEELLALLGEQRDALERPIDESQRRIAVIKETIRTAEQSLQELGFLLMAEQQRLSDWLVSRRQAFLARVLPDASHEFGEALRSARRTLGPSYRRSLHGAAQEIARRHVVPWLHTEQEEAEREYRRVAERFVEMANEFLGKLAAAGISELARIPHALDRELGFRVRSEFSFLRLTEIAQPASPLRWLADLVMGSAGARRKIEQDAQEFLCRLLETNSMRVQSDILNRVQESRGRLEAEIRKLLHEVSRMADHALSRARAAHAEGEAAVRAAVARLDQLERQIREVREAQPG